MNELKALETIKTIETSERWVAPTFTVEYQRKFGRGLTKCIKCVKSKMYLDRSDWHGETALGGVERGMSSGWYQSYRQFGSDTAPAVRSFSQEKESLNSFSFDFLISDLKIHDDEYVHQMRLLQDKFGSFGTRSFMRTNPPGLMVDGMTTRERWENIDAFQTWRHEWWLDVDEFQRTPKRRTATQVKLLERWAWADGTIPSVPVESSMEPISTTSLRHRALVRWGIFKDVPIRRIPNPYRVLTPYTQTGLVTDCETGKGGWWQHVVDTELYAFGDTLPANVTPGKGISDALSSQTHTSYDANHRSGNSAFNTNRQYDGDEMTSHEREMVSVTMNVPSTEPECDPDDLLHLGVRDFNSALEQVLVVEVHRAWTTASKADNSMSDSKLAVKMRRDWKSRKWEAPKDRIEWMYSDRWLGFRPPRPMLLNKAVTEYLRGITPDQVRRQREKFEELLRDRAAQRAGMAYDAVLASLAEILSNLAQSST